MEPQAPKHAASTTHARLLLFNTQHASPGRAYRQAEWISTQESADFAVLTEVSSGPGGSALVEALGEYGYSSVIAPESPGDYYTVLASRSAELHPVDSGVSCLPHRAPAASVTIGGQPIVLLGLYVPSRGPRERRNEDKRDFQNAVAAVLPDLSALFPETPVIVAGDLNVIEPNHMPPHSVFGQWEYAFYKSFAAAGFTDAYRHLHPDTVDHSWFGRSGNGFRFDHIFTTTAHAPQITACAYEHAPRAAALTDHAAMTLTLTIEGGSHGIE
ncbi:endonuclease [Streptomyces sp. CB03238]|nr:endonuclease [Streptomyces sp. CB03238]